MLLLLFDPTVLVNNKTVAAIISIAPCLTDKVEHSAVYKIYRNE